MVWNFGRFIRMKGLCIQLTIHLPHCSYEVIWILETHKTISFCLTRFLVSDYFCLEKRWVFGECSCELIISNFVTKVTTEYSEVIWGQKLNDTIRSSEGWKVEVWLGPKLVQMIYLNQSQGPARTMTGNIHMFQGTCTSASLAWVEEFWTIPKFTHVNLTIISETLSLFCLPSLDQLYYSLLDKIGIEFLTNTKLEYDVALYRQECCYFSVLHLHYK